MIAMTKQVNVDMEEVVLFCILVLFSFLLNLEFVKKYAFMLFRYRRMFYFHW